MLATIWGWIKTLYNVVVKVIYAAVSILVIAVLLRWGINWFFDRQWQQPFQAELVASGYDSKIVGLTRYKVLDKVYLSDPSEANDSNLRTVPIKADDAIITIANNERLVFISAALPHLFTDVTNWAQNVHCVEAQVRKRLTDGNYTPYETVFWLTYKHPVRRESETAYQERVAKIEDENDRSREHLLHVLNNTHVESNSALLKGTCTEELGGWIELSSD